MVGPQKPRMWPGTNWVPQWVKFPLLVNERTIVIIPSLTDYKKTTFQSTLHIWLLRVPSGQGEPAQVSGDQISWTLSPLRRAALQQEATEAAAAIVQSLKFAMPQQPARLLSLWDVLGKIYKICGKTQTNFWSTQYLHHIHIEKVTLVWVCRWIGGRQDWMEQDPLGQDSMMVER